MPRSSMPSRTPQACPIEVGSARYAPNLAATGGAALLRAVDPAQALDQGQSSAIGIALSAALITVRDQEPMVLVLDAAPASGPLSGQAPGDDGMQVLMLPAGPLRPSQHRTLEQGVRELVSAQARIELGYTEQLCSFADQGRVVGPVHDGAEYGAANDPMHRVSIGYLALLAATHVATMDATANTGRWLNCYDVLPWEDWRAGRPEILTRIVEQLDVWARCPSPLLSEDDADLPSLSRRSRIDLAFGLNGSVWDEERTLERHELLYDAGLLSEVRRDAGVAEAKGLNDRGVGNGVGNGNAVAHDDAIVPLRNGAGATTNRHVDHNLGLPLAFDHRRMLAVALGRLRGKIKYRPIVFDLMAEAFTLFELQCTVEAILGTALHKQNFRRLVESTGLVEEVGDIRAKTGGRPARLFRFRPHVVLERSASGVRIKSMRG
jgi:hypothetical protein